MEVLSEKGWDILMNKKAIVFFCAFLALLFALAACGKHTSPYGQIVVDQQGMEHVIMTDANGVTVVDSIGNLVEIMTDSSNKKPLAAPTENGTVFADQVGDYQTHAITFPGIVENGDQVENQDCIVTVPKGWEQIGNGTLILRHKDTDASMAIYTDLGGTLTGALEDMENTLARLSLDYDIHESDVTVDGLNAVRTQYDLDDVTQITYLLQTKNGEICRINCTVQTERLSAVDFDAVLQTVHFK